MAKKPALGVDNIVTVPNEEILLNKAITMIDNAKRGILVDTNGKVVKDFNLDMERMQRVFDAFEDIRISAQDIKAVMFKPIIRMVLPNPNVIEGRTQFKRIWNFTQVTLYDELNNLSEAKLQEAYQKVYDSISSFERYVLSELSDNPKEWDSFIEAVLDQFPIEYNDFFI